MPRAKRLCSHPGCLNAAVTNGRCREHPHPRYAKPWERNSTYGKQLPLAMKARVLKEEPSCRICGNPSVEVDHIVPRSLGGSDTRENLQGLCRICHSAKTAREGHAALSRKRNKQRRG